MLPSLCLPDHAALPCLVEQVVLSRWRQQGPTTINAGGALPMLQFSAGQLRAVASAIFQAAGAPEDRAAFVANSLATANLMGHDSHGVLRVQEYCAEIEAGTLVTTAQPEIMMETATTATVSGNWGFGHITARAGAEVAIKKAKETNVAVVGLVQQNHIGRLGEWSAMMAEAGLIGMVVTGGWRPPAVAAAPFGGAARLLNTNPYSFAIPTGRRDIVLVDFATTVIAEGKVRQARAKGVPLPAGAILDKNGNASTDPNDYYAGGVLLPAAGHKGYSLALVADLLSLLVGADTCGREWNCAGTFMLAVNIAAFRPLGEFTAAVDSRLDEVKSVPPAPGFAEVLIPGEPEQRTLAQREREGIGVPEATWAALIATGQKFGVDVPGVVGP
jgi:LDH2 family malate/lactate/ureidoglycolate dehydrogenase